MRRNDRKLLKRIASGDDVAFATFYRAHLNPVVAFFRRRVPDGELAFDLAAETFAVVAARGETGKAREHLNRALALSAGAPAFEVRARTDLSRLEEPAQR